MRLRKIDSIQNLLFEGDISDPISRANEYFKIGELYRMSLISDSAYFYLQKAEKVFKENDFKFKTALTLYGIAVCQTYDKDYTGSEVTSFEALTLLDKLDSDNEINKYKSFIYNNLGIVFNELGQFEESVKYHSKALDIKKDLVGDFRRSIGLSKNNLAFVYKNIGRYELAIKEYEDILSDSDLIINYPDVHVLALGNYANTLYLSNNMRSLPYLYLKALKICDSIDDGYNSIIIHQHLAEYYNRKNIKDSAKFYAYKAKKISEHYNNDDLLKSLLLLSKIEEGDKSAEHLKAYVKLNDSLQKAERKTRNKFARIRFETQQIEEENERIARERSWLIIVSIILSVIALLIYVVISQRVKNKELIFAKQQQEANEEIYNLMLGEHDKIEEARNNEKKRISQELHDGVLGRLFGTRLSLDSLNIDTSTNAIKTRGQYITELKTIEDDIRKVSHELNTDFVNGSGFTDIINTLVATQTLAYKLDYNLEHDNAIVWESVSNKRKIHIYRILQEVLHNIYKHANASVVNIGIILKNNVICLSIKDNGSGFDVSKAKSGIGLKNMNARIKEVKGTLKIESERDLGTTVKIKVPIKT